MQTFLTSRGSMLDALRPLDDRRLFNQHNEGRVILAGNWPHHPVHRLWPDRAILLSYLDVVRQLCLERGIGISHPGFGTSDGLTDFPEFFYASHRANLLRKDPVHYGKFGWQEKPKDWYAWLSKDGHWYVQRKGEKFKYYVYDPALVLEFFRS